MNERLAVVIPGRNEKWMQKTVDSALLSARDDVEVVAVLDGYEEKFCLENNLPWPMRLRQEDGVEYDPRLQVIRHSKPTGQRASTNEGARASDAKYFMKADAHILFDEGFDVKLKENIEYDWTVMPQMYILDVATEIHTCPDCGNRVGEYRDRKRVKHHHYCGRCHKDWQPEECVVTKNPNYWTPKWHKSMDFMYISVEAGLVHRAQYWYGFKKRPESKQKMIEMMVGQGACWFQYRQRFLDMGGLDEAHGSWGQVGVEIACKAWLSGGKHFINKNTWFAHWFRGKAWPYPIRQRKMNEARDYSRNFWRNGKWPLQRRPLSWLARKFWPVPKWKEDDVKLLDMTCRRKAIVYYTDGSFDASHPKEAQQVRDRLVDVADGIPIVCVSQTPLDFGEKQVCVGEIGSSHLSMFKQILAGVEAAEADTIYLAEHDCLYSGQHFQVTLHTDDKFVYNTNVRWAQLGGGRHGTYTTPGANRTLMSQLVCGRQILIDALKERIAMLKAGLDLPRGVTGICEPGANETVFQKRVLIQCQEQGINPAIVDGFFCWESDTFENVVPNIDIRHSNNLSGGRRGSNARKTAPYWGCLEHALDGVSAKAVNSKWYQPVTLDGVDMPARSRKSRKSRFYGDKKWDGYIEPLIPFNGDACQRRLLDIGCNAGLHLHRAAEMGFGRVVGVEPNDVYFNQARFLIRHFNHKDVKIINGTPKVKDLPLSDVAILANVLCWMKPGEANLYVQQLAKRSLYCIVVSRNKESNNFASDGRKEFTEALFANDWELVGGQDEGDWQNDPSPTPMYSRLFRSAHLAEHTVCSLYDHPDFQGRATYRGAYREFVGMAVSNTPFDIKTTAFYDYVKGRNKWGSEPSARVEKWAQLAMDIRDNGINEPVQLRHDGAIKHGLHRLIVAKELDYTYIVAEKS